jgi:hypothetical protein
MFFIVIKPFVHLDDISTREKADQQMRDRFVSIIGRNLVISKLCGTNAMVYEYMTEANILSLPSITRDTMFVTDVAPADRWNYESLQENEELKMKTLVTSFKEMCAEITECTPTSFIFNDHFQSSVYRVSSCFITASQLGPDNLR